MKKNLFLFAMVLMPSLAKAFSLKDSSFKGVIFEFINIINILIPILVMLAIVLFFWGVSRFILNSDSADGIKNGRNFMIWGIIALFVLFSVRVIIGLIATDSGLGDSNTNPGSILLPTGKR